MDFDGFSDSDRFSRSEFSRVEPGDLKVPSNICEEKRAKMMDFVFQTLYYFILTLRNSWNIKITFTSLQFHAALPPPLLEIVE